MRRFVCTFVGMLVFSVSALAQNRNFVASTGLDTNPCSRTQPCRSFNKAISTVITDGEVIVLDSAGYGPATINKAVSIVAPSGIYAGITVTSADGFVLTSSGGVINLKGLSFIGLGGNYGINIAGSPAQLNIDGCLFSNFSGGGGGGINVGGMKVTLRDSEFRNNNIAFGGSNTVSIDHCRFDFNGTAVATTDSHVVIRDSVFFGGNTGAVAGGLFAPALMTIENCMFSDMTTAVSASGLNQNSARVRLSATTIVDTTTAMAGAHFVSFGNNRFDGNTTIGTFDATIPLQ